MRPAPHGGPSGPSREHTPPPLKIETHRAGERMTVAAAGEIDLDTVPDLRYALRKALAASVRGVDLDLAAVDFCDCSGLNVLLRVRQRALQDGKTVVIRSVSAVVERLLALSETASLFTPTSETDHGIADRNRNPRPDAEHSTTEERALPRDVSDVGDAVGTEQSLRVEVVQLKRAMQTRPVIDLARGVLMASFGLNPEDAWSVLVMVSQNANIKLHHLAEGTVAAVTGEPLPEALRQQLSAAVAELAARRSATQESEP
ncbi:anti-sigma factor antagonist [Streptomyces tauricus]|uniref:anti-sigma factor antagonist n=1 Tax=Streptomyces tauricus TaxID=68274 RepID=UPI002242E5D1|nr:anti-sigma factor antagonist [Streptomyces tauricus]MCW8097978.1 anti-sigma factor antagonist [Streptomyces tauricus]